MAPTSDSDVSLLLLLKRRSRMHGQTAVARSSFLIHRIMHKKWARVGAGQNAPSSAKSSN